VEGELEIQTARGGVLRFKRAGALPDPSLAGMAWELQTLNGQPPLADAVPTLAFSEREISGVTGCNRYFGMYKAADGALTFGTMGVTEMYCMDPPGVMEQEQAFLAALGSVRSYQLTAERLDMLDAAGEVVLSFTPSASL